MKSYISASLREQIAREERYRCGYCLRTEELAGMPMSVDHIVPSAAGGADAEENLCLACRRCDEYKGTQTHARDPETGETAFVSDIRSSNFVRLVRCSSDFFCRTGFATPSETFIRGDPENIPDGVANPVRQK